MLATHVEDSRVPGPWLQSSPALIDTSIWGMNQLMEDWFSPSSLLPSLFPPSTSLSSVPFLPFSPFPIIYENEFFKMDDYERERGGEPSK